MVTSGEPTHRPPNGGRIILVGSILVIAILAVGWLVLSRRNPEQPGDPKTTPGESKVATTNTASANPRGYVGIQACEKCHAARVKEFKSTRHYLACMPPNPEQMPAAFESGNELLTTSDPNLHFEMTKVGKDFVQKTVRTPKDGKPQETTSVVSLVYGQGGIADQVYFGWQGNRLYEFPVARLLPQNAWGASKFDKNGAGDFSREVTPRCLECHNVWFKQTPGTLNEYDRQEMLLGVTCEKCHGPGRDHVAWHKDNPAAKTAEKIIHPGHLDREGLMAVCGQCHSNAAKYSAEPFTYTPGQPLDQYFKTLRSRYPEEEHVANQDKYLRESKCYQQSETMTCITCHDPHHREGYGTPERQQTCLKCHEREKCADRPKLPAEVRDNCTGCHMPLVNKIQVHFFTSSDAYVPPAKRYEHRIAVYPRQRQELLLAWRRKQADAASREEAKILEQDLVQEWIKEGDELRGTYRFLAAIDAYRQAERIKPTTAAQEKLASTIKLNSRVDQGWFRADEEIQKKKFKEAAQTLEDVLALKPDLAPVHGKLGSVYASLGDKEKAHKHLEAVSLFDPDEPYGESMLGWLAYLDGQHDLAIEHYRRAEEMEPRNIKVRHNEGLAHLGLQRWPEAEAAFRKTLALDPKHSGAYQGLSHALRGQGQTAEALKNALQAAELTRYQSADVLLSLADAYADAGKLAEAQNTAARALAAAKGGNPQFIAQIAAKIEELRKRAASP
jgi:tetratricopeptide (TPR) repeat protein